MGDQPILSQETVCEAFALVALFTGGPLGDVVRKSEISIAVRGYTLRDIRAVAASQDPWTKTTTRDDPSRSSAEEGD